jgi:O-antigen ligase
VYGFMASWRVRQQRPNSLAASAVIFAYPMLAALVASLVVFWRRLHVLIIGGGQQQASTDARGTQWAMGWPKIISHPFGHGAGNSGEVLGFFNPGADSPTVDSYFLTLLLDYGFIGLASFLVMMFLAIWYGFRAYNRAKDEHMLMLAPLTIALFNFTVIKAVSSTEGSLPIVFVIMGCVVGLTAIQQRQGLVPGFAAVPDLPDEPAWEDVSRA